MKSLRKIFAASVLTIALVCSVLAGDMSTTYTNPPPSTTSVSPVVVAIVILQSTLPPV